MFIKSAMETGMDQPWEDNLLERKVESDLKDLLKTLVAFSNSVRPGHTAVILIGEADDGSAKGVKDPDSIQKTVRDKCQSIYPPILWRSTVYQKDTKACVRVEIEYDGETPHFGGKAWIRKGSITQEATEATFQRLVDYRSSKVRELAKWRGKMISIEPDTSQIMDSRIGQVYHVIPRFQKAKEAGLVHVNGFWATFEIEGESHLSEPLEKLTLSWDDSAKRLKVLLKP
jgi:hypothetical protein